MDAEPLVVEQVGEEPDHVEQGQRDAGPEHADHDRQGHEAQDRGRRGEVAERSLAAVPQSPIGRPDTWSRDSGWDRSSIEVSTSADDASRTASLCMCGGLGEGFGHDRTGAKCIAETVRKMPSAGRTG